MLLAGLFGAATRSLDAGPDHPDEWDPRVADLAAFVEDERGHEFDHPVHVDFLTPAEYTAITTEDDDGPSEEAERADFDDYAGQLRGLGVASGELDLYEAFNSVVDSGTLAFYDPTDERIRVRGTEMSVGLEVTIVHELTHALQDQHFDLDRLNDETVDSGASAAFRGLGEGDALRVENAYIDDELTDAEQAEYDEEYAEELADSETATSDVPPFMEAVFGVPYALGQPFVTMLFKQDGNDGVDDAFEQPPDTEEHLLDPASFLAEESADDASTSTSTPTTPRSSRRDRSAPRPGTCSSPSGSIRRSPSRPPSAGTAMPSRPTRRTARCASRRCSSATPTPRRRRWPPRSTSGRRPWSADRPRPSRSTATRHRDLRPRRGHRPRAHRPLRDVPLPPEPVGLPGRRCGVGARSRGQPLLRRERSWTT